MRDRLPTSNFSRTINLNLFPTTYRCDDFYLYACGNYIKAHNLTNTTHKHDQIDVMRSKLERELNETFYEDSEDDIDTLRMSKKLFRSCMDLDSIEKRGVEPLKILIDELGGWPVVEGDSWNESASSWEDVVVNANRKGLFIQFPTAFSTTHHSSNNSSETVLQVIYGRKLKFRKDLN